MSEFLHFNTPHNIKYFFTVSLFHWLTNIPNRQTDRQTPV